MRRSSGTSSSRRTAGDCRVAHAVPADLHALRARAQAEHEPATAQLIQAARVVGEDQRRATDGVGDRAADPAAGGVLCHCGERNDRRAVVELAGPGGVKAGHVGCRGHLDRVGHPAGQHAHPTGRHARNLPACNGTLGLCEGSLLASGPLLHGATPRGVMRLRDSPAPSWRGNRPVRRWQHQIETRAPRWAGK